MHHMEHQRERLSRGVARPGVCALRATRPRQREAWNHTILENAGQAAVHLISASLIDEEIKRRIGIWLLDYYQKMVTVSFYCDIHEVSEAAWGTSPAAPHGNDRDKIVVLGCSRG